jgi:hypothetical protein
MRSRERRPRSIADMREDLQAIQTTGAIGSRIPAEIPLADLLSHPALADLQPDERAALHMAAEHLERRAAAGVGLRLRIAHVGDVVPISLLDARAAVYCTIGAAREVHVWVNGYNVTGKSGMTSPVLLELLAAAAGTTRPGHAWTSVALQASNRINAISTALHDDAQPVAIQSPADETINT